jgi:hypothetical protein
MQPGRTTPATGYYRRSPHVASRVVDGEALLLKRTESKAFILNHAASRIWVLADGVRSGDDLADARELEAVRPFLDEMVERGLLERAEEPLETAQAFPQDVEWQSPDHDFEPPAICSSEVVEILAGLCDSNREGMVGCQTTGPCIVALT